MIARKALYTFTVSGVTSEVSPGLWQARTGPWAITAYGSSAAEAEQRIQTALALFVDALARRRSLDEEFQRVGIRFTRHDVEAADEAMAQFPRAGGGLRHLGESSEGRRFEADALVAA